MKAREKMNTFKKILITVGLTVSSIGYSFIHEPSLMNEWNAFNGTITGINSPLQTTCPPENSHLQGTAANIGASCRGENDDINQQVIVNDPSDYIMSSHVFEARNIRNSTSDAYCKHLTNTKRVWNQVGNGPRATIQDLINYQCSQNTYSCSSNLEGELRDQYSKDRASITNQNVLRDFPTEDQFFGGHLLNARFYDTNGVVKKIPKELLIAVMHEESQGKVFDMDDYDYGLGLFNIRRATRMVRKNNGIVSGIYSQGNDYHKYRNADKFSLYNPINNLAKFTQVVQGKYLKFQQTFNGQGGRLDFDSLSEEEKYKFILTAIQVGDGNVIKAYDRLQSFNTAMNCNSCDAFKKQGSRCGTIRTSCSSQPSNKCGKTLPVKFDVMIRFSNFTGQESSPEYQENFSCLKNGMLGRDSNGPCNLALTKAKTYRIMAGYKCMM